MHQSHGLAKRKKEHSTMAERNILILGKVATGKKTLGNHIVGEGDFSHERISRVSCHYKEQRVEGLLYRILTVDTESLGVTGYFDPVTYIRGRFDNIHLIIFVTKKERYTEENHKSLMRAVRSLDPQARSLSALVITHCEGITDENRQGIVHNFKVDPRGCKVADFIDKGIYTVGFPDTSNMSPKSYQSGIDKDENIIRRMVKDCDHSLSVKAMRLSCFRYCWRSVHSYFVCWDCSRCLALFFSPCYYLKRCCVSCSRCLLALFFSPCYCLKRCCVICLAVPVLLLLLLLFKVFIPTSLLYCSSYFCRILGTIPSYLEVVLEWSSPI